MRKHLLTLIFLILPGTHAFGQIDTLQLLERDVLESPLWILEHYFVDLDNDGRKEIIICDVYNIYVYDSQTLENLWTSPILHIPTNLVFEDINSDGFIDIAAEDDYRVYLFDPHDSLTIWSSPLLDNRYNCYAMGDRNDDGWGDVAIVTHEFFTRYDDCDNLDTTWISVYDGPTYDDADTAVVLLPNYDCYFLDIWHRIGLEEIVDAELVKLSGDQGLEPSLVMFSRRDTVLLLEGAPAYLQGVLGRTVVIDGMTLNQSYSNQNGLKFNDKIVESESGRYMYVVAWTAWGIPFFGDINLYASKLGANSNLVFRNVHMWPMAVYHFWDWEGSLIDDIYTGNGQQEICFAADDSMYLQPFEYNQPLWFIENVTDLDRVLFTLRDPRVFDDPQVICSIRDGGGGLEFRFYDGFDGSLTAVMPSPSRELTATTDLEGDGIEEIIALHRRWLYIYNIDIGTAMGEPDMTPKTAFLDDNYPNPFNSSTTIEYGLAEAGPVKIAIYDLLGRTVETLVDEWQGTGRHRVVWEASGYSSGVYFYRLKSGDHIETKRMVYLR